jgi:hypothetical protein
MKYKRNIWYGHLQRIMASRWPKKNYVKEVMDLRELTARLAQLNV